MKKWKSAFDESTGAAADEANADKNQDKPKKQKRQRKPKEPQNPNLIKTSNKLIGVIENLELYDSDDVFEKTRENLFRDGDKDLVG